MYHDTCVAAYWGFVCWPHRESYHTPMWQWPGCFNTFSPQGGRASTTTNQLCGAWILVPISGFRSRLKTSIQGARKDWMTEFQKVFFGGVGREEVEVKATRMHGLFCCLLILFLGTDCNLHRAFLQENADQEHRLKAKGSDFKCSKARIRHTHRKGWLPARVNRLLMNS